MERRDVFDLLMEFFPVKLLFTNFGVTSTHDPHPLLFMLPSTILSYPLAPAARPRPPLPARPPHARHGCPGLPSKC